MRRSTVVLPDESLSPIRFSRFCALSSKFSRLFLQVNRSAQRGDRRRSPRAGFWKPNRMGAIVMRFKTVGLGVLLAALAGGPSPAASNGDLVVHEWGTFLAMNGSDGITLDGMYHEEHALPAFVHSRGRDQLRISSVRLKGETPVIYFYTKQPQDIEVSVRFPQGIWTQWYPQAGIMGPQLSEATSGSALRNGHIHW